MRLTVTLAHCRNPDIPSGYWNPPEDPAALKTVEVENYEQASKVCREYIVRNGLGAGNWGRSAGVIRDEKNKPVAEVSFNGRVWPYGTMQAALPRPGRTAPAKPQPLYTP